MFDLHDIRENPARFDRGWIRRGLGAQTPAILELDGKWRGLSNELQAIQQSRNELSKQIGVLKAKGQDASDIMAKVAEMKERMPKLEEESKTAEVALKDFLSRLPNLPQDDVPDGKSEADNVEQRRVGNPSRINNPKDHADIGEGLGMMDFASAAKMSGARFVALKSGLARMERALAQLMLDTHTTEFGYTEMSVPLLVKDEAVFGTGQLPKFSEDLFRTTTGHWLVPTAEVSLTNMVMDSILDEAELPIRVTAFTPCFRSEAGAAGKDTRGMIRQHQFWKVELVSVVTPDKSKDELERMTGAAETILKKLELPFRTIALCTGDMGFCAQKTYDIEVWLPAQNTYREISSCSNCGDFQARRMNTRYRPDGDAKKGTKFIHTLNGSGLAVGRCLVAVLENYQQPDGSVMVPSALKPYMGGIERLHA